MTNPRHGTMNITIRDLDVQAYEALCVRAALEGRTAGEVINDAIRYYLAQPTPGKGSLRTLEPILLPGNEPLRSGKCSIVVCRIQTADSHSDE